MWCLSVFSHLPVCEDLDQILPVKFRASSPMLVLASPRDCKLANFEITDLALGKKCTRRAW